MPSVEELVDTPSSEAAPPPAGAPQGGVSGLLDERVRRARGLYEQGLKGMDAEAAGMQSAVKAIGDVPAPRNYRERFKLRHSPEAYMRERAFEAYKNGAINKHVTGYLENMERIARVMAGLPPTVEEERELARREGESALIQEATKAGFATPEGYIGFTRLQQLLKDRRAQRESQTRIDKGKAETDLAKGRLGYVTKQTEQLGKPKPADVQRGVDAHQRRLLDMQKALVDDIRTQDALVKQLKPKRRLPGAKASAQENNALRDLMALRRSLQKVRDELYATPGMETFGAGIGARPPGFMEGMESGLDGAPIRPANTEARVQQLLELYGYGRIEDVPEEVMAEIAETLEAEGWE